MNGCAVRDLTVFSDDVDNGGVCKRIIRKYFICIVRVLRSWQ